MKLVSSRVNEQTYIKYKKLIVFSKTNCGVGLSVTKHK